MFARLRKGNVPEAVGLIRLAKRERVLAWCAIDPAAGHLVATTSRLIVLRNDGQQQEWPWDRIIHGQWDTLPSGRGHLRVTVPDDGRTSMSFPLNQPGSIPAVVRDRVSATMAGDFERVIADGTRVRFIGRRPIGQREVRWTVMFPAGVDPTDPDLRAAADAELNELKANLGS